MPRGDFENGSATRNPAERRRRQLDPRRRNDRTSRQRREVLCEARATRLAVLVGLGLGRRRRRARWSAARRDDEGEEGYPMLETLMRQAHEGEPTSARCRRTKIAPVCESEFAFS